ncbi:membrane protein [Burkholderia lata]|uniref:Membrane protein n=1 Tax=Burkholderia lata (strain ATCC 17760 / DSM 23089 / LMG 22485 / NCIMB 9086 / R18194 / 383) TaxID=482957 RepID=A0A6P2UK92_BURL3|nr:DMT family transporter [Burkholderia lata]VWC77307.1 membrane protein [Burkholderia lata]
MQREKILAVLALVGAVACWTGNYLFGGVVAHSMDMTSIMYIKWGTSVIPLLIIAHYLERPNWMALLRRWRLLFILSMLGITCYSFGLFQALRTSSAMNASLINAFNPVLILIGSTLVLKQKLSIKKAAGIFIALIGVLWVTTGGHLLLVFEQRFKIGDLWMLGVITCWAAYTIIIRLTSEMPPLSSAGLQILIFTVLATPFAIYNGIHLPPAGPATWSIAYIAIFPSVVAYALWNLGARVIEPAEAGQYLNLVVPFAAVGTLVMGNGITTYEIVGGAFILAGVFLSTDRKTETSVAKATASA